MAVRLILALYCSVMTLFPSVAYASSPLKEARLGGSPLSGNGVLVDQ